MFSSIFNRIRIHFRTQLSGVGNCSKCSCIAFDKDVNNENMCQRCGHSYSEHY